MLPATALLALLDVRAHANEPAALIAMLDIHAHANPRPNNVTS